jgi:Spy/CpxP family protein refolding chaperone
MIKPGDDPNELGPGRGPGLMLRQLDLTEEQQEKIKSIHETNQKAMQEAREAVQKAMQALRQAVEDEGDEETVNTAAAAVGKAMGQRAIMRIKSQKAVKAVLTEEQLKKMEELKEKAKACREAFGDDGPGGFRGERQQRHHPRRHRR